MSSPPGTLFLAPCPLSVCIHLLGVSLSCFPSCFQVPAFLLPAQSWPPESPRWLSILIEVSGHRTDKREDGTGAWLAWVDPQAQGNGIKMAIVLFTSWPLLGRYVGALGPGHLVCWNTVNGEPCCLCGAAKESDPLQHCGSTARYTQKEVHFCRAQL